MSSFVSFVVQTCVKRYISQWLATKRRLAHRFSINVLGSYDLKLLVWSRMVKQKQNLIGPLERNSSSSKMPKLSYVEDFTMNSCSYISQQESEWKFQRPLTAMGWNRCFPSLNTSTGKVESAAVADHLSVTFVCLWTCNQHTTQRQTYLLSLAEKQNYTLFIIPLNKKHLFPIADTTSLDNRKKKTILNK